MTIYRVDTPHYWTLVEAISAEQVKDYFKTGFGADVQVRPAVKQDINAYADNGQTVESLNTAWDPNDEALLQQEQRAREIESGLS